jgi:hypothetical protein
VGKAAIGLATAELSLGVLALAGCGAGRRDVGHACTLIGCTSGISIDIKQVPRDLPHAHFVRVCVAGYCSLDTVYETPAGFDSRSAQGLG